MPATECTFVVSRASSSVRGGSIVGNRRANIVLPEPGGPIIRTLCPPAAATSSARFAVLCPRTSEKSRTEVGSSVNTSSAFSLYGSMFLYRKKLTASCRLFTGKTSTPLTIAASLPFAFGTMSPFRSSPLASILMDSVPRTGASLPSRESSPTIRNPSTLFCEMLPEAARSPMAIGRSNPLPSFLMSAGARFITILP